MTHISEDQADQSVTATDPAEDAIAIVHNPDRHRYEIRDGTDVIGFTEYRPRDTTRRVFIHTEVDPAYGGRGLAGRLVKFALDDVAAADLRIVPICPYVAKYVKTHHDWDERIDWPRPRS